MYQIGGETVRFQKVVQTGHPNVQSPIPAIVNVSTKHENIKADAKT